MIGAVLKMIAIGWLLPVWVSGQQGEEVCDRGLDRKHLLPLHVYVNSHSGVYRDHFTTTHTVESNPNELRGYQLDRQNIALMARSGSSDQCPCLVKLVQRFDDRPGIGGSRTKPGIFGNFDHKLTVEEKEKALEMYKDTGEQLYCAREKYQCGATLPLRRLYKPLEMNTVYSLNETAQDAGDTLCYIWKNNYQPDICSRSNLTKQGMLREKFKFNRDNFGVGTTARLECVDGYASNGADLAVCQRDGSWLPRLDACITSPRCASIEPGNNAQIDYEEGETGTPLFGNSHPEGSLAFIRCETSFGVGSGATVLVCNSYGNWTPDNFGQCQQLCAPLEVSNGQVKYLTEDERTVVDANELAKNSKALLSCNDSQPMKIEGAGMVTCGTQTAGQWSNGGNIGTCVPIGCPSSIANNVQRGSVQLIGRDGSILSSQETLAPGSKARLTCRGANDIPKNGAREAVCYSDQQWKPKLGTC